MPLGVGAGSDGILNTTPLGDDQVLPPPALPIANLQIIPPASIPPGGQAVALISFDLIDDLTGPKGGAGVVQLVFEITAIQAGGMRRESIEVYLFLPPRLFLPIVLKNH